MLSTHTFGSFTAEKCFKLADMPRKKRIAKDLASAENRLLGSKSGSMLLRKCRIDLFKKRQSAWELEQSQHEKRESLLLAVLGEDDNRSSAIPATSTSKSTGVPEDVAGKKVPSKRRRVSNNNTALPSGRTTSESVSRDHHDDELDAVFASAPSDPTTRKRQKQTQRT